MRSTISQVLTKHGKQLIVTAVSFSVLPVPAYLTHIVEEAFDKLAPYIKDERQTLYLRDIRFLAIDSTYPGGHCYNRHEAMIAVPDWKADKQQVIAAINHELHHMARWQNAGYGETLGGAILSEGIATYYEELQSGWKSPWSRANFTKAHLASALKNWDDDTYKHSEWFFESAQGRWLGYGIGYQLARNIFSKGFNMSESLSIKPSEAKNIATSLKA